MNDLRSIKTILYTLKRAYGLPINIVWRTESTPNLETGKKTVQQDSVSVDRAIILPATTNRNFVYDLVFIASNKNFTYGGFFDKNRRKVIIDRADLPRDFEIKIGHYLIINSKRYEVKNIDTFDVQAAYDLDVEQVDNIDLENQIKQVYYEDLFVDHSVEVLIND